MRLRSDGLVQPALGLGRTLQVRLARRFHDSYGGLLRVTHGLSDVLSLWAGAGGESAAVPDRTIDAASPDGIRISGFGGLSVGLTDRTRLLLDLTYQHVLTRKVLTSDYEIGNGTYKQLLLSGGAYLSFTL